MPKKWRRPKKRKKKRLPKHQRKHNTPHMRAYRHTRQRYRERYEEVDLSEEMYLDMCSWARDAHLRVKDTNTRSIVWFRYRRRWVKGVYSKSINRLVTVLPPKAEERDVHIAPI